MHRAADRLIAIRAAGLWGEEARAAMRVLESLLRPLRRDEVKPAQLLGVDGTDEGIRLEAAWANAAGPDGWAEVATRIDAYRPSSPEAAVLLGAVARYFRRRHEDEPFDAPDSAWLDQHPEAWRCAGQIYQRDYRHRQAAAAMRRYVALTPPDE